MAELTAGMRSRLRAVIDRVIPADHDPGALDLGADNYVLAQLAGDAAAFHEDVLAGLDALEIAAVRRHGRPFAAATDDEKDDLLAEIEGQPWFICVAELTAEGFYADPDNGGNLGAGSWTMIGYEHRLPEGPSGPPAGAAPAPASVARR